MGRERKQATEGQARGCAMSGSGPSVCDLGTATDIVIEPAAIVGACRDSAKLCPVARAVRTVCKPDVDVVVSRSAVQLRRKQPESYVVRLLPESLSAVMAAYDKVADFPPWLQFALEIPPEFLRSAPKPVRHA